jgi:hypothetical protein
MSEMEARIRTSVFAEFADELNKKKSSEDEKVKKQEDILLSLTNNTIHLSEQPKAK